MHSRRPAAAPLLVVLSSAILFSASCNRDKREPDANANRPAPPGAAQTLKALRAPHGRLIILGFDGVDPRWLDRWMNEGKLPTLRKLTSAHEGRAYRHLRSTNPPQSPVAWTTFATGTEPGEHGIFDFIGRSFGPSAALPVLPKVATTSFEVQPSGPPVARNLRTGQAFWQLLGNDGVRVVAMHVPYSFPPDPMREGRMVSGLGVPDLRETNSTFTYAGSDVSAEQVKRPPGGGVMVRLTMQGDRSSFELEGPTVPGGQGERMKLPVEVERSATPGQLKVGVAGKTLALEPGVFSDWVELVFTQGPHSVSGITKFLALAPPAGSKDVHLFVTPISMHPRAPYSPFSYPKAFSAQLADEIGSLYKTVGWDHDTSALNAEVVDEAAFLADLETTERQRREMLMSRLGKDDWDLLIWVSTATDRVAHMFYRLIDPDHPRYDAALAQKYGDAIEREYRRMDESVAAVLGKLRSDDTLLIISDHGFHGYRRGLHVNQWLRREGLLTLKNGAASSNQDFFLDVDWSKTKAYALGTGQVYLNRAGREPQGIVSEAEAAGIAQKIRDGLIALRDGDKKVVDEVYIGEQVFRGGRAADRPDLQVAFAEHYRTSWESILGGVPAELFADNTKKWSGDHAASDVKETDGILISNRPIARTTPAIVDLAPTAVTFFGRALPGHYTGKSLLAAEAQ